jgi:hypothetical protein
MKKTLTIIALAVAAIGAQAQDASSTSNSGSNSGANSAANATGNVNASRSDSASQSGALSGSQSGANGNTVIFNPSSAGATATGAGGIPTTRFINEQSGTSRNESVLSGGTTNRTTVDGTTNQNLNSTSRNINEGTTTANQNLSGGTTNRNVNTDNINYSGTVDNKTSGGTYNVIDSRISGTQTIKTTPSIAMSGPASGPCTGMSGGVGLSGPGWGVGINGSTVMDDCRMRENTRVLGMGMQSLDGAVNPQEKGEATVMFMDAMRNLASYNNTIYQRVVKENK